MVASRFLVPLAIPRFPLPAVLAALVIDAADQTVFAAFDAEPANYQSYDKALDIYYLTIAYISTIRNWTDAIPFRAGQFLWYFRLVGVVAFESSGIRALLVVFPNTFEYFFIFYELVRVRWEPSRLTRQQVLAAVAAIWVCIKLPQESWIHLAQLDVTDVLGDNPWLFPTLVGVLLAAARPLGRRLRRLPPADWSPSFDVDAHATTVMGEPADPPSGAWALINHPLVEKTVLVSLVSVIFAQVLPDVEASALQLSAGVAIVVVVNASLTDRLALRGGRWRGFVSEFLATGALNAAIVVASAWLLRRGPGRLHIGNSLFFLTLLTLIVTLYDRYRTLRLRTFDQRQLSVPLQRREVDDTDWMMTGTRPR